MVSVTVQKILGLGNQQPSTVQVKVQRLSREGVLGSASRGKAEIVF